MDSDPAALKRRRSTAKAACTRIKNYVDSITSVSPSIIAQIIERREKLEQQWVEYNDNQTLLEMLDPSESNDRTGFEEAFFKLAGKMRELTHSPSTTRDAPATTPTLTNFSQTPELSFNVRLPKLDLPKFSGRYEEWFPFRDAFNSVIHTNSSLTNVHKLQYLRAALTGDASRVISSLEISEANYAVAWKLLNERYDNKRVIVQSHLKSIIELPVLTKENAAELRQIADGSARHV